MIRHDFAPLIRCFFYMPARSKTSRGIFYSSGVAISCASPNCQLPEIKFLPAFVHGFCIPVSRSASPC